MTVPAEKACTKCREIKPIFAFTRRGGGRSGFLSWCRSCVSAWDKGTGRQWRRRLLRYGLTPDAYDEMLAAQGNLCAICRQPWTLERMGVDHDHRTGKVRGLLCGLCNKGIGLFKDDPELMEAAIRYLKAHIADPKELAKVA